jgi:general secretion pathway protein J
MTLPRKHVKRIAAPQPVRGFTLLEILIGLVLLSIMMTLLFGSIRMGARIWDSGETRAADLDRMLIVQNFLRYHLSTVRPVIDDLAVEEDVKFSFSGTDKTIQFVSDLPSSARRKGLHQFNLEVIKENDAGVLIANIKPFYPSLEGSEADIEAVRLISGIESMVVSYFGADRFDIKAPEGQWVEQWEDREFMPFLIKIEFRMQSGRNWPPLMVTPRLSASDQGLAGIPDDELE